MSSTEPVLPSSRRPVALSPDVQAEIDRRGRSAAEIQRDITRRTERLSANIDELSSRLAPSRLARDGVAGLKARLVTPNGRPRVEVLGALAGTAVVIGLLLWRTRRR